MKAVFAILILSIFGTTGVVQTASFGPLSNQVKIEITHTHEHGDDAHSHELPDAQSDSHAASENAPNHQDTHTHLVTLVSAVAVTIPSSPAIVFLTSEAVGTPAFAVDNPPADRALDSIFRPPIQS